MSPVEEFYKWVEVEETLPPKKRRGRKPSKKQYFTYITQEAIIAYNKEDNYCSYQTVLDDQDYCVYLFNQRGQEMLKDGWYTKYFKSHI